VAPNRCSKQKAVAKSGEFMFFVQPMIFWGKMREWLILAEAKS
jgi:hypothetical protein